jgi:hypothetical protein
VPEFKSLKEQEAYIENRLRREYDSQMKKTGTPKTKAHREKYLELARKKYWGDNSKHNQGQTDLLSGS